MSVKHLPCRPLQNTVSKNEGKALMKLVVDADSDAILGAHMVGPEAAEILMVGSFGRQSHPLRAWNFHTPDTHIIASAGQEKCHFFRMGCCICMIWTD